MGNPFHAPDPETAREISLAKAFADAITNLPVRTPPAMPQLSDPTTFGDLLYGALSWVLANDQIEDPSNGASGL